MKAWINNKEFEFQEGETILHAAKRLGILFQRCAPICL